MLAYTFTEAAIDVSAQDPSVQISEHPSCGVVLFGGGYEFLHAKQKEGRCRNPSSHFPTD